jgi:hypothetical protein
VAATDIDVANEALSLIGSSKEIQNLETDRSNEARACNRFFGDVPRPRAARLPLAAAQGRRGARAGRDGSEPAVGLLVPDAGERRADPPAADRRVAADDNGDSRIPYELGRDDTGGLIFSDYTTDDGLAAKYIFNETTSRSGRRTWWRS